MVIDEGALDFKVEVYLFLRGFARGFKSTTATKGCKEC